MTLPRLSFAAQMAIVLALVLLLAQTVSFAMLLDSRERLRVARTDAAIARFLAFRDREVGAETGTAPAEGLRGREARPLSVSATAAAARGEIDGDVTARFRSALDTAGYDPDDAVASRMVGRVFRGAETDLLLLSAPLGDGLWLNQSTFLPPDDPIDPAPLIWQTSLIYCALLAGTLLVTSRLSRPLARLTRAADTFDLEGPSPDLPKGGAEDVRALARAFVRMRARLQVAFREKDVMLGALGHDLRTPLTSLRIRAESIDDDTLRGQMVDTLDEMAALLEDILSLARRGPGDQSRTRTDITAMLDDIATDHAAVTVAAGSGAVAVDAYPMLLRRAVRNLVENAVRYAEGATLHVVPCDDRIEIVVADDGPGIADEDVARLRTAFERGDGSRNRGTGGTGLGLAIAEAAAEAHGGTLELRSRTPHGLEAVIVLPRGNQSG